MLSAVSTHFSAGADAANAADATDWTNDPTPAETEPHEWRTPRWRARLVILGLVATAMAVLAQAGGLDKAPAPPAPVVPTVAVGETVDGGPWKLTVTNSTAARELGTFTPSTEGNWLLAIAIRIEVTGPESEEAAQMLKIATLPEFNGLTDRLPTLALVRDASRVETLHPGLPERVAFIFEVSAGTPVPDEVIVALGGWTRERSWTTRRLQWTDFDVRARVRVPVKNAMEQR